VLASRRDSMLSTTICLSLRATQPSSLALQSGARRTVEKLPSCSVPGFESQDNYRIGTSGPRKRRPAGSQLPAMSFTSAHQ
jgi:hypothetical protein